MSEKSYGQVAHDAWVNGCLSFRSINGDAQASWERSSQAVIAEYQRRNPLPTGDAIYNELFKWYGSRNIDKAALAVLKLFKKN